MSQDPNYNKKHNNQSQSSKLQETLDRISAMESNFNSLKEGFEQNITNLATAIQRAAKQEEKAANNSQNTGDKPTNTARADTDCKEFFDDKEALQIKIKKLAQLIRKSKHFVAFTGAGISTSAGIPDFRSGRNTILNTGSGKWEKIDAIKKGKKFNTGKKKIDSFKAYPTPCHMALVSLIKYKYLKYIISQNTDGLHRRSGIPKDNISELHGNRTLEVCDKCTKGYIRDYTCRNSRRCHDHKTGRYCTVINCGGNLCDTIINFGENPHLKALEKAESNSKICDLMLCLGSSLTVIPAAYMPEEIGYKWKVETKENKEIIHNLVIVNLQKTPCDDICSLRIFAKIDDVMVGVMKELDIEIPEWNLEKFLKLKMENLENRNDLKKLNVSGVDIDGVNASVFTCVKLRNNGVSILKMNNYCVKKKFKADEYVFYVASDLKMHMKEEVKDESDMDINNGLVVELTFYGHYNEPKLLIRLNEYLKYLSNGNGEIVLKLVYNIMLQKWIVKGYEEQRNDKDIGKLWIVDEGKDNDSKCDKE
eukprot:980496_1